MCGVCVCVCECVWVYVCVCVCVCVCVSVQSCWQNEITLKGNALIPGAWNYCSAKNDSNKTERRERGRERESKWKGEGEMERERWRGKDIEREWVCEREIVCVSCVWEREKTELKCWNLNLMSASFKTWYNNKSF